MLDAGEPSPCVVDWVVDLRSYEPAPSTVHVAGDFNDWSIVLRLAR